MRVSETLVLPTLRGLRETVRIQFPRAEHDLPGLAADLISVDVDIVFSPAGDRLVLEFVVTFDRLQL